LTSLICLKTFKSAQNPGKSSFNPFRFRARTRTQRMKLRTTPVPG
jgi:hypothetical protein